MPCNLDHSLRCAPFPTADKSHSSHLFVNRVRFWSMCAIIAVHSMLAWGVRTEPGLTRDWQMALVQAAKFGTIGFYLISGFLLGERLPQSSAVEYLRRRAQKVGGPWALWASLFACLLLGKAALAHEDALNGGQIRDCILQVMFQSVYWFVPNFLFALSLLLIFRRRLDDLRFGAALLLISLFYGVNVYGRWIPSQHTAALLGYVFYLWLGNWASRHWNKVSAFLEQIPLRYLAPAILLTGSLALGEAHLLSRFVPEDGLNTLRVSNQLFSLLVVLGLVKCRWAVAPKFIDVRAHTFGQYLLHPLAIFCFHPVFDLARRRVTGGRVGSALDSSDLFWTNPLAAVGLWAAMFVAVYGASLVLAQWLARRPALGWTVGQWTTQASASAQQRQPRPAPDLQAA